MKPGATSLSSSSVRGPMLPGGRHALLSRGSLVVSEARDLTAVASVGGAYGPDGAMAWDTCRVGSGFSGFAPVQATLGAEISLPPNEEEVLWGGDIADAYGAFLTESVSRLWPLLPGGELEGLPAVFTTPRSSPYVTEWMEAFGVRTVDLPERGAVRFTKMFVPEMAWRLSAWIAPEVRDINLHARSGMDVPPLPDHDVLWLSRAGLARERVAYDEVLLEWLLGERIVSIRPETMALAEQVAAFEGSRAVAGVIGSAFHTLLMTEKTPECLYLCPEWPQGTYPAQHRLLDARSVFAGVLGVAAWGRREREEGVAFPAGYRISIPDALHALDETVLPGLLEDARLAAFADPERRGPGPGSPALESSLDDAVLEVLVDPLSIDARRRLAAEFEAAAIERCAREQIGMIDDLVERV